MNSPLNNTCYTYTIPTMIHRKTNTGPIVLPKKPILASTGELSDLLGTRDDTKSNAAAISIKQKLDIISKMKTPLERVEALDGMQEEMANMYFGRLLYGLLKSAETYTHNIVGYTEVVGNNTSKLSEEDKRKYHFAFHLGAATKEGFLEEKISHQLLSKEEGDQMVQAEFTRGWDRGYYKNSAETKEYENKGIDKAAPSPDLVSAYTIRATGSATKSCTNESLPQARMITENYFANIGVIGFKKPKQLEFPQP